MTLSDSELPVQDWEWVEREPYRRTVYMLTDKRALV